MNPDAFADACRRQVDDDLYAHAWYAAQLGGIILRLNDPSAGRSALDDIVTQRPEPTRYDHHDAAAIREIALLLDHGHYVIGVIPLQIGRHPGQPRHPSALPAPFLVSHARDGTFQLHWTSGITITHAALPDRPLTATYPPSDVPLELGYINPPLTLWHIRRSDGIARWPTEHSAITLILPTSNQPGRPTVRPTVVQGAADTNVSPTESVATQPT
ncbi:MAG TPA: hypothetical protein VHX62_16570 [Solirubrobacteraceae bacterium]|jgi:hypothetical protein|nr:hypothetical protein [Solirubrobacteraceae bacterium]